MAPSFANGPVQPAAPALPRSLTRPLAIMKLSAIIILWRLEDLFARPLEEALSGETEDQWLDRRAGCVAAQALRTLRENYAGYPFRFHAALPLAGIIRSARTRG